MNGGKHKKMTFKNVKRNGFFTVILVILFSAACSKKEDHDFKEIPDLPKQIIENFNVTETKDGQVRWVLNAESAEIQEENNLIFLVKPRIEFYENGKYTSTLSAADGRIDTESYDIYAYGKCLLNTVKGEELRAHDLKYHSDIKRITTDKNIMLKNENEIITGTSLEADPDLTNIKIKNQKVEIIKNEIE